MSGAAPLLRATGRPLWGPPRLLLLDEPSLGLAPRLVDDIFRVLGEIHRAGTTILLAEQNAWLTLGLSTSCYLLEIGRVVAAGPSQALARDERIVRIYLGDDTMAAETPSEAR
jgi:branched-chain amino acid transport system ATP-binding protein